MFGTRYMTERVKFVFKRPQCGEGLSFGFFYSQYLHF